MPISVSLSHELPAEDPAAASSRLAVDRIATELARLMSAGDDEQHQEWVDYLSGKDKDAQLPVNRPRAEVERGASELLEGDEVIDSGVITDV